jgi:hypothetical protein
VLLMTFATCRVSSRVASRVWKHFPASSSSLIVTIMPKTLWAGPCPGKRGGSYPYPILSIYSPSLCDLYQYSHLVREPTSKKACTQGGKGGQRKKKKKKEGGGNRLGGDFINPPRAPTNSDAISGSTMHVKMTLLHTLQLCIACSRFPVSAEMI